MYFMIEQQIILQFPELEGVIFRLFLMNVELTEIIADKIESGEIENITDLSDLIKVFFEDGKMRELKE